ncbi:hypothetical protein HZ326_29648 [Fusarium oxysporum f. sp. albedinis]|nr:hypothetical protein HZ326_29648 [Fusarium oxysporum f. sp. albedinis]
MREAQEPTAPKPTDQEVERLAGPALDRKDRTRGTSSSTEGSSGNRPGLQLRRGMSDCHPHPATASEAPRATAAGTRTTFRTQHPPDTTDWAQDDPGGRQVYGTNEDPRAIEDRKYLNRRRRALGENGGTRKHIVRYKNHSCIALSGDPHFCGMWCSW